MIFGDLLRYPSIRPESRSSRVLSVAAAVLTLISLRSSVFSVGAAGVSGRYRHHLPAESSETSAVAMSASLAATDANIGTADEDTTVIAEYCRGGSESFEEVTVSSGSEDGLLCTDVGQPNKRSPLSNHSKVLEEAPMCLCIICN